MDLDRHVRRDFESLLDRNPLKTLPLKWQEMIWSLLYIAFNHADWKSEAEKTSGDPIRALHEAASVCEELCKLIKILRKHNFGLDDHMQELLEILLLQYCKTLKIYSSATPQAGRHDHHMSTQLIVKVSFMVHVSTGKYNDAHLSALAQLIAGSNHNRDCSEEAIRKRRDRLRKEYPREYEHLVEEARLLHLRDFAMFSRKIAQPNTPK